MQGVESGQSHVLQPTSQKSTKKEEEVNKADAAMEALEKQKELLLEKIDNHSGATKKLEGPHNKAAQFSATGSSNLQGISAKQYPKGQQRNKSKGAQDKSMKQDDEERFPHEDKIPRGSGKSITDQNTDITTHQWHQWYNEIQVKLQKVLEENKKVSDDCYRRTDRYYKREQKYRTSIEDLQSQLRLRVKDVLIEEDGENGDGKGERPYIRPRPIQSLDQQFQSSIENIMPITEQLQREQKNDIIRKFNSEMLKQKKKLEEQKSFKGDQEGDLKERENEMQHNLELITSIAQRIDNENRLLIKKNAELLQEYKAQENDRSLLVRQLVMQKKENQKYKEEMEEFENIINEKARDEEQIDIHNMDGQQNDGANLPPQSKMMQARMNSQQQQRMNQSSQGWNNNFSDYGMAAPLVYQPQIKTESEEQKILRYERVIDQLKKMVDNVRKQNKNTRAQFEKEVQSKTELEHYLKKAVNKVMKERKKNQDQAKKDRKQSAKFYITALDSAPDVRITGSDSQNDFTQEERERIIEILLAQDKVINLLYDRPQGQAPNGVMGGPLSNEMQAENFMMNEGQMYAQQMDPDQMIDQDVMQEPMMNNMGEEYQQVDDENGNIYYQEYQQQYQPMADEQIHSGMEMNQQDEEGLEMEQVQQEQYEENQ